MRIIRKTKSVKLLTEAFERSNNAVSVVDLTARFKQKMNKTTVYRILDKLEKEGVVHSFIGTDGLKRYAKCSDCSSQDHFDAHPHFQCQNCGKSDCLDTDITIPFIPDRKVEFTQILLIGICEKCMA